MTIIVYVRVRADFKSVCQCFVFKGNEATMLRPGLETFFHPYFINSDNLNVNVNVYEMQNKYELFKKI